MKVRLPKSYLDLPQSEKDKINEAMTEQAQQIVDRDFCKLQRNWLKFACIVLHNNFGFGARRLLCFLGNWREIYRFNASLKTPEAQAVWLDQEMNKIFGKEGYPEGFVDRLEEIGRE
jgi:hypothetical protein